MLEKDPFVTAYQAVMAVCAKHVELKPDSAAILADEALSDSKAPRYQVKPSKQFTG